MWNVVGFFYPQWITMHGQPHIRFFYVSSTLCCQQLRILMNNTFITPYDNMLLHYCSSKVYLEWRAWILFHYVILRSWYSSRVRWILKNCRSKRSFAFSSAELCMLGRKWQCVISVTFNNSFGSKSPYMELEICLGKSGQDVAMSPYFICVFSLLKILRTICKRSAP